MFLIQPIYFQLERLAFLTLSYHTTHKSYDLLGYLLTFNA